MATPPEGLNKNEIHIPRQKEVSVFSKFRAVDVTDKVTPEELALFGQAQYLTSDEYAQFHKDFDPLSPNKASMQIDLLEKVTGDKYSTSVNSRLKTAVNTRGQFAGSLRFTRGSNDLIPPVESMNLYVPVTGNWPHMEDGSELTNTQIGEFGRIATMVPERKQGNTPVILSSLFEEGFKDAREQGIKKVYIIMPTADEYSQLRDHLVTLGYNPTVVENVRLRTEDETVSEIIDTFSNYWIVREPKLHVMDVPDEHPKRA